MLVYLIAILWVLFGIFLTDRISAKARKNIYYGLCVYLILIMGFRYRVGIDTLNYMLSYHRYPSTFEQFFNIDFTENKTEPGYNFIVVLCKSFTDEFWLLQMVMAAITNIGVFIFIRRNCKKPFTGVFFYLIISFLYFTTEILRESAAISIFLLNYSNLEKKKWFKYYFYSLFSIAFHYSAIIILFFPLFRKLKINVWYIVLLCIFFGIAPFFEQINNILTIGALSNRIDIYTEQATKLTLNWRLANLFSLGLPTLIALMYTYYYGLSKRYNYLLLLQLLFCAGAFAIPLVFARFTNYTIMFTIVVLANILTKSNIRQNMRNIAIFLVLFSQSYGYATKYVIWFPYVSIFNEQTISAREQYWHAIFRN